MVNKLPSMEPVDGSAAENPSVSDAATAAEGDHAARNTDASKLSLLFILDASPSDVHVKCAPSSTLAAPQSVVVHSSESLREQSVIIELIQKNDPLNPRAARQRKKKSQSAKSRKQSAPKSSEEKRRARNCTFGGCTNYTINKGLCFRHGGGKKCTVSDCDASAKVDGLCWKHGGSVPCSVADCDRRGKSRGLCWAHGGGKLCDADGCSKVAVSNGFCWAHGGGKRCLSDGCQRPAYERTLNYCPRHFKSFEQGDSVMEL